jgi:large conductance mechanosensitive channel
MSVIIRQMFKDFKKFILRGNLVDLAIGFTVGAAFSTVAKSLVNDIIMPPIGLLLGKTDFADLFILLKQGSPPSPYASLSRAEAAGAVTINYGNFLNNVFSLILVGFSMYLVIKGVNRLDKQLEGLSKKEEKKEAQLPADKKCPFCFSVIPYKATKCPQCTSSLPKVNKSQ